MEEETLDDIWSDYELFLSKNSKPSEFIEKKCSVTL